MHVFSEVDSLALALPPPEAEADDAAAAAPESLYSDLEGHTQGSRFAVTLATSPTRTHAGMRGRSGFALIVGLFSV